MAKIGRRRLAREVVRLLNDQPERRSAIVQQVAGYLIANKQINQLDLLIKDIADELFVQNQHLTAQVEHAHELTEDIQAAIRAMLTRTSGAASVELHSTHNPNLLGGVIVRTPRQELDASVRQQLKQIAIGVNE